MIGLSWASILLVTALAVVGCAQPYQGAPYAQGYGGNYYAPPPQNPYATPWVGANTPWVFYQGDWFLNGMLYHNYGNQYGWAPYYAYPSSYIVRPNDWYAPRWNTWYQQHPNYYQNFTQKYPYWRDHHSGQRYDQNFYNRYHRSQGEGWQRGFQGHAIERPQSERPRPGPGYATPREGPRPGPAQVTPREGPRPGPGQVTPREGPRPGSSRVTPSPGQRPGQVIPHEGARPGGPAQITPHEGQGPGPARMAPSPGQRRGPAQATPREGSRPGGPAQITPRGGQSPGATRIAPSQGQKPEPAPRGGQKTGHDKVAPPEGQRPGPAQ
jgi:hypothetical protein